MLDLKTFKSALEQLEEERKIPKEKILDAIEQAMAAAYKKDYGKKGQIIRAKFDLETGKTEKQVIIQKIREAERTSIIDEYGTKEGEIVGGIVQKVERGNVYVDFNRATGILPAEEQIPGEFFQRGQRIRAYLYSVEDTPRGINLRLSRTHPKFIEKLFAQEAPEIQNGIVEIKSVAREPGSRSKIAVHSNDEHIDAVGSCVGQKGTRVNTITQELNGEKIDIIPWSLDVKVFVSNSISPAKVISIELDVEEHKATIEVANDQLSLAIGKGGQNVRLAAKLTGWRIDIKGDKEKVEEPAEEAKG